jgi:hypothetical protein
MKNLFHGEILHFHQLIMFQFHYYLIVFSINFIGFLFYPIIDYLIVSLNVYLIHISLSSSQFFQFQY